MVRACLTAPPRACRIAALSRLPLDARWHMAAASPKLVGSGTSETEAD